MNNSPQIQLFLLLIFVCTLIGIPQELSAKSRILKDMTLAEGLSDLLVNAFCKDTDGYMWIGTGNCLDRFDGVEVKHYPFPGTDVIRKRVYSITMDEKNEIWVGNGLGLWHVNRSLASVKQVEKEQIRGCVFSLLSHNNTLYIGTDRGLFVRSNKQLTHLPVDSVSFRASNQIKGMVADSHHTIWLATAQGLFAFYPETKSIRSFSNRENILSSGSYRAICNIGNQLFIATDGMGVVRYDIPTNTFYPFTELNNRIITAISEYNGLLYISTDGNGLFIVEPNGKIVEHLRHEPNAPNSIRSNSIYSTIVDRDGLLWVGYFQAGFDYSLTQKDLFKTYRYQSFSTEGVTVRSFLKDGNKKLIGTRDGLLYIDEEMGISKSFHTPELSSNLILSLTNYNKTYYIGTYGGGLMTLNPTTLTFNTPMYDTNLNIGEDEHIFNLVVDNKNRLWICSSKGLYNYLAETKECKKYDSSNSQLCEGMVFTIFFDSSGKGWICTETGVCFIDPESNTIVQGNFPEGFPAKEQIREVFEDSNHQLYFLPLRGDVARTDLVMSKVERLSFPQIAFGSNFLSMAEDSEGWLWVTFDGGIIRFKENGKRYNGFSLSDGLPSLIFCSNCSYKDEQGKLWFCNAKGLLELDPSKVDSTVQPSYPIRFSDIRIRGEEPRKAILTQLQEQKRLELNSDENSITVFFSNLSYINPNSSFYEYQLEGMDKEWKMLRGEHKVTYFDLPQGIHTLKVRSDGFTDSEQQLSIQIGTPTNNISIVWVAIIVSIMGGMSYIGFRKVRTRSRFLQQQSDIKQEELLETEMGQETSAETAEERTADKYKNIRISENECKELFLRLELYMKTEKPYSNPDLKIGQLAHSINCASHILSYLFSQYLNITYYDYVNAYRVEAFKRLVIQPGMDQYTLTALAEQCGFSSRASFFRSFKKHTGITPNEFIQQSK